MMEEYFRSRMLRQEGEGVCGWLCDGTSEILFGRILRKLRVPYFLRI